MVMTKKFLVLNMVIVLVNAAIGLFINMAIFSGPVGVRERFVVLPEDVAPNEAPVSHSGGRGRGEGGLQTGREGRREGKKVGGRGREGE